MATWLTYSGLTRQEFSNPTSIGWKHEPCMIVLHSTEGNGYPSEATYRQGRSAPHFTVNVRGRSARQHYPLSEGAWALQAPVGVSTNSWGAVQIEIIGTCARTAGIQSVLTFTDDDLAYLAGLLSAISDATGIPLVSTVRWLDYPASAGASPVRLSPAQFYAYRGVLGHQHVPGNTHGDPGTLNVARLLEHARGVTPTTPDLTQEDDVDLNNPEHRAQLESLIAEVLRSNIGDTAVRNGGIPIADSGASWWVSGQQALIAQTLRENVGDLALANPDSWWSKTMGQVVDDDSVTAEQIAAAIPDGLAERVADVLGKRLNREEA